MRILIGYNGTDASTAAIHDLKYAGLEGATEAVIFTVAESWLAPKTPVEASQVAADGKALLTKEFPDWTVSAETASGSPAREILARAQTFDPDLIVLGEPRQKLSQRNIFLGQTSQTILTEAKCSVRIARGLNETLQHAERILIGFDGSAGAARAVRSIAARRWPGNTSVRLLAVADQAVLRAIGRFTPEMTDAVVEERFAAKWAETLAADALKRLSAAGIPASIEVRLGHPKDTLIKEAEAWNADTIYVGPHCSSNSFERFILGSVSSAVAARAHCSVEVVRSRAEA